MCGKLWESFRVALYPVHSQCDHVADPPVNGNIQRQSTGVFLASMSSDQQVRPNPKTFRAVCSMLCMVVAIGLAHSSMLAQTGSPISGTVETKDGQPVQGVYVYGSRSACCPEVPERTTTDKDGWFHLEHPGAVIHLEKENLEPLALVVAPGTSEVRATMELANGDLALPTCGALGPGQKLIGWGHYGVQFEVPERNVKISGGKPDVDYVVYVVKPNGSSAHLELWFGPYAIDLDPEDDLFINSSSFTQRNVTNSRGVIGRDSSGHLRSGGSWRQIAVVGAGAGGARYRDANPEDAALFDQVVNSICQIPYPEH